MQSFSTSKTAGHKKKLLETYDIHDCLKCMSCKCSICVKLYDFFCLHVIYIFSKISVDFRDRNT